MSNIWYLTQTWNVFVNKIWSEDSRLFCAAYAFYTQKPSMKKLVYILDPNRIDEIIFIV